MATLNLGRIKPVFRGAWTSGAYVIDDIVTHGDESFICIQAGTNIATSNASYWTKMAAKGTNGTDVGTTITTQGDILYRDGSGLARLGAGTSGYFLKTQGTGANPVWSEVTAKFIKAQYFHNTSRISIGSASSDIDMFTWGNFNKQSATSKLYYHGYIVGRRTENNSSFNKFTATPSSGSAEINNHMKVHSANNDSIGQQFFNLQGKFSTAFATGNVELKNILSSDNVANRGHSSGMIINPNNTDDSRWEATSAGSHLVVYEIED